MITVILPTIRPELYFNTLKSISRNKTSIETIVVADFEYGASMLPPSVKWIHAPEKKGVIDAINKGYAQAQGDYIFTLNDESLLHPHALDNLELFCKGHQDRVLASPVHIPAYPFYYYKRWFAPFPFAHRNLIEACAAHWNNEGTFFDPAYENFYADPDLSMKAYEMNFEVLECPDAVIVHSNDINRKDHKENVEKSCKEDRETFKKRWSFLGTFVDP